MASSNVWTVLPLPLLYLILLFFPLYMICSMYKIHQASKHISVSWFPPHLQRDVFLSLRHMEAAEDQEFDSQPPPSLLKAALLRRAAEDVQRGLLIRKARQACEALLSKGSIGVDISKQLEHAGAELDIEAKEVAIEANALASKVEWAETIFQSAKEVVANGELRRKLGAIEEKRVEECEWWERRQAIIIDELLQEFGPETMATLRKGAGGSDEHVGARKEKKGRARAS